MKLVIATKNKNKAEEIKNIFADIKNLHLVSLTDEGLEDAPDIKEDGISFEENAEKKSREISAFCGLPAMADDSGLCVDALDGRPGIFSARYAGENATDADRIEKLLKEMEGKENRNAKFVCAIAITFPGQKTITVRGECAGQITAAPEGENGFGYDPVFYIPEKKKTMAQISMKQKNCISHRAKALEKAAEVLKEILE